MLILADCLIDSTRGYEIYHGDFPVVINSDELCELFICGGSYADTCMYKDHRTFYFVAGKAKSGEVYRLSDIFAIPDEPPKEDDVNPRDKACDALRGLMDAANSGKRFYRSVFNFGGTDAKNWRHVI